MNTTVAWDNSEKFEFCNTYRKKTEQKTSMHIDLAFAWKILT